MSEEGIVIPFGFEEDGSAKEVKTVAQQVAKELGKIATEAEFDRIAEDAAHAAIQFGKTKDVAGQLSRQLEDMGASEKEVAKVVRQYKRLQEEIKEAATAQARFDKVSQDVALAGDVESNLRAVGGAAGAFGFGGVETGISQIAELPALVEALPRLKESLMGLPSALSAAASSLGPVGLGLGAVALAGAAAFKLASSGINKAVEELRREFANLEAVADVIASSDIAQFESKKAQIELDIRSAQLLLDNARLREEQLKEEQGILKDIYGLVGTTEAEAAQEEREKQEQAIADLDAQLTNLNEAYNDGTFAASENERAQKEMAEAEEKAAADAMKAAEQQEQAAEKERTAREKSIQDQIKFAQNLENIQRKTEQNITDAIEKRNQFRSLANSVLTSLRNRMRRNRKRRKILTELSVTSIWTLGKQSGTRRGRVIFWRLPRRVKTNRINLARHQYRRKMPWMTG
jgi:hypothetical protein